MEENPAPSYWRWRLVSRSTTVRIVFSVVHCKCGVIDRVRSDRVSMKRSTHLTPRCISSLPPSVWRLPLGCHLFESHIFTHLLTSKICTSLRHLFPLCPNTSPSLYTHTSLFHTSSLPHLHPIPYSYLHSISLSLGRVQFSERSTRLQIPRKRKWSPFVMILFQG